MSAHPLLCKAFNCKPMLMALKSFPPALKPQSLLLAGPLPSSHRSCKLHTFPAAFLFHFLITGQLKGEQIPTEDTSLHMSVALHMSLLLAISVQPPILPARGSPFGVFHSSSRKPARQHVSCVPHVYMCVWLSPQNHNIFIVVPQRTHGRAEHENLSDKGIHWLMTEYWMPDLHGIINQLTTVWGEIGVGAASTIKLP